MRILFDQGTPVPLRRHLTGHSVDTAYELGWSDIRNGELLDRAEEAGFEILLTTDQKMRYQQSLTDRQLAVLVLLSTAWPRIQTRIDQIQEAIESALPGEFKDVPI